MMPIEVTTGRSQSTMLIEATTEARSDRQSTMLIEVTTEARTQRAPEISKNMKNLHANAASAKLNRSQDLTYTNKPLG